MAYKPAPVGGWLDEDQQRAWLAFMRVQLRMTFEMNRQLQADSGLSLSDYDVLNALSDTPGGCLSVTALAARLGWERSRLSHHAKRMAGRGLVSSELAVSDRRVTEISLTTRGRRAVEAAAIGHVELVRRLFFDGLTPEVVRGLSETLETVYANILERGSLPRPDSIA
ncbi:MarR family winged helix-turn-helix transcriptional regulator [Actinoplanes sp. N902-109]|uniref:MarR family winged helix-turn-helix transcriptional regulator n=1 Tax=Actinoplanes sp. (strain N902-109) TaxID=649831 RepID=UPI00032939D9|nr:MarR family transcriptional regulator [Actinoplanes sp. N902-109]AGL17045.1 putative MarR-family protein regulatory protein [Actinoplanes sp. N902-109]